MLRARPRGRYTSSSWKSAWETDLTQKVALEESRESWSVCPKGVWISWEGRTTSGTRSLEFGERHPKKRFN